MAKVKSAGVTLPTEKLLKILSAVRPALMFKDFIPVFSHFCFEKNEGQPGKVTGYNDVVGIAANIETGIHGGIPGDRLLGWLGTLPKSSNVDITAHPSSVTFSCGKAKLKCPLFPAEEFVHKEPKLKGIPFEVNEKFLSGMEYCLLSAGDEGEAAQIAGVTFTIGKRFNMYATDGISLTKVLVSKKESATPINQVLPTSFCKILSKLMGDQKIELKVGTLSDKYVGAEFLGDIQIKIWSKLINTGEAGALDYEAELKKALSTLTDADYFEADADFIGALQRVGGVYGAGEKGLGACNLVRQGNALTVTTAAEFGGAPIELKDDVVLPSVGKSVDVKIDVFTLIRIIKEGMLVAITENFIAVKSGGLTYLQSHLNG